MRRMISAILALLIVSSIAAPVVPSSCAPCADNENSCELYKCVSPRCSTGGNCAAGACQTADIPASAIWELAHARTLDLMRFSPVVERSLAPPEPPPQRTAA